MVLLEGVFSRDERALRLCRRIQLNEVKEVDLSLFARSEAFILRRIRKDRSVRRLIVDPSSIPRILPDLKKVMVGRSHLTSSHISPALKCTSPLHQLTPAMVGDDNTDSEGECSTAIDTIIFRPSSNGTQSHTRSKVINFLAEVRGDEVLGLKQLEIHNDIMGKREAEHLGQFIASCQTLEVVVIHGCHLTPAKFHLWVPALRRHRRLKHLDLSHNQLGNDGCEILEYILPRSTLCTKLQSLNMAYNGLNAHGAAALARLAKGLSNLKTLVLDYNRVWQQGVNSLHEMAICHPKLCEISLVGCKGDSAQLQLDCRCKYTGFANLVKEPSCSALWPLLLARLNEKGWSDICFHLVRNRPDILSR